MDFLVVEKRLQVVEGLPTSRQETFVAVTYHSVVGDVLEFRVHYLGDRCLVSVLFALSYFMIILLLFF